MNEDAMKFVVSAIEPTIKQMHRKFSRVLSWEMQDFTQEAYLKVCEPLPLPDSAGPIIGFFAKSYKNHILDQVRKVKSQDRICSMYQETIQHVPRWYDDTNALELSHIIDNELPEKCKDVVMMLLNGKTSRQIMSELPGMNRFSYYKALNLVREEVKRFYVLESD